MHEITQVEGYILSQMKIKVLLADDNKDFCDIVVNHLQKQEDIQIVAVAMDGIDAMNKIREHCPDVAIIDGIMPRLDGIGVLERLQKNSDMPPTHYYHIICTQPRQSHTACFGLRG